MLIRLEEILSPVLYGLLYDSPTVHASVFGFSRSGEVIPLHDHPTMHGFVTVLRGALKVHLRKSLAIRDYMIVISESHNSYFQGNIHEITALESGSFFFDVLFPGYGDSIPCTYFQAPDVCLLVYICIYIHIYSLIYQLSLHRSLEVFVGFSSEHKVRISPHYCHE
uniref:Auxin-binding protein n=1 Tax=Angiostrongylus cantonensis TaxID=6313 RepID=A0A0K0CTI0_ANGCA